MLGFNDVDFLNIILISIHISEADDDIDGQTNGAEKGPSTNGDETHSGMLYGTMTSDQVHFVC